MGLWGKLTIALSLLGGGLLAAQTPPAKISASDLARRVDTYYNSLHSLRADFSESYEGMGIHRDEQGTLILRKPGKMRWNYTQPAGKIFILDGKFGWFYSSGDAQAQRLAASKMDDLRSPLRFLLGHTQLAKEFENLTLRDASDGMELSGVPRGMQKSVSDVTFGVTADGVIQSIRVTGTDGARTSFHFTAIQPNAPAPDTDFVFHPPSGVPVVDGLPPV